jgi:regulator of sigma E protease
MDFLISTFYFILVLGILVLVHEWGHFIAAKLMRMRAEVFSIGMGPRLFGYHKRTGFTFGKLPEDYEYDDDTEYRLSILPIGGYVKIAGMIDESMDKDYINKPPQPYEFRSKKAWQKFIVLIAGVVMNFVLAVAIFGIMALTQGKSLLKTTEIGWVDPKSIASDIGFQSQDKILKINFTEITSWNQAMEYLTFKQMGKVKEIQVQRGNEIVTINGDGKKIIRAIADQKPLGLEPDGIRVVFQMIETLKPAGKAGFKKYDSVLYVNDQKIFGPSQFSSLIRENKGKEIVIKIKRQDSILSIAATPNNDGKIGVALGSAIIGKMETIKYNVFQSVAIGFEESMNSIYVFLGSMGQIFNGNLSFKESVGGPIMIAKQATQQAEMGLLSFLNFIALLSVTLAVINILPLPALDGGHLVFVLIEAIIRKEISPKVKMAIQQSGVVLLLLLMVFVIYNDITR